MADFGVEVLTYRIDCRIVRQQLAKADLVRGRNAQASVVLLYSIRLTGSLDTDLA